ncbi:TrmH family RNA methyltransferase [Sinomicrobium oceani]|uniref:TrmH family RNA methyltransferase n=1 Tax=Sinomicrobium oceani TaxID=1150368 RepID=UPI00227B4DB1|nr:TrmH family RNA methyltransferase [Sinomicrobium oceani]
MQLTHQDHYFQQKHFPLTMVCDNLTGPANIGALFRIAEAFGVQEIRFCGARPPVFSSPRMKKTARAADKYVSYTYTGDTLQTLELLKTEGYSIISLEITDQSIPVSRFDFASFHKIALVIGNESSGVSPEIIQASDHAIHIEMFGNNSSMNVIQATGIALYEITRQIKPLPTPETL